MSERGIIFSGEMVRASLDGRKTQTRRIIKPQPNYMKRAGESDKEMIANIAKRKCPYGDVGDRLYVREAYQIIKSCGVTVWGTYLADKKPFEQILTHREHNLFDARKKPYAKTSGQFMYKSLARIWLEITNIRVERVQDIDENDAYREGCELYTPETNLDCVRTFSRLWDSLNAKRGYGWDKNPWVWVIEFKLTP